MTGKIKLTANNFRQTFRIKECPECRSENVGVVITGKKCEKGKCEWECHECDWRGKDIAEKEISEDEFLACLDERGK